MNYRVIFYTVGRVLQSESVLLLIPSVVSLCYGEWNTIWALLLAAAICLAAGTLLTLVCKPKSEIIFAKEGLITVSLAWIFVSLAGALPFVFSGLIPSYIDAVFETVSGFTTTGASIMTDVELTHLTGADGVKGIMFWRCFTHWVGGMGILVFVVALSAKISDRSMQILRAEMPGPIVDKLVPKTKDTAKILYIIYLVLTAALVILLLCGGMSLYDSLCHAFGTAGTGGFGIKNDSMAGYSPYCQWVVSIFLVLFGINFNLYFLMIVGKFRTVIKSEELWTYIGIIVASTVLICINLYPTINNLSELVRTSFFQVTSIATTAGFSTVDFNAWPPLSKGILLILMLIGACAGSTAGGFKVSRVVILFKKVFNELRRAVHPRSATIVKSEGKRLDEDSLNGVGNYLGIYVIVVVVVFLLLGFDSFGDIETNLSATFSCFNNIGPAFGKAFSNYAGYSDFSTVVLTIAMLLGRLEIYPLLLTLSPTTWIKR